LSITFTIDNLVCLGQQLVQLPGGKIQVVYTAQSVAAAAAAQTTTAASPVTLGVATSSPLQMPALTRTVATGTNTPIISKVVTAGSPSTPQLMAGKMVQATNAITPGQVKVGQTIYFCISVLYFFPNMFISLHFSVLGCDQCCWSCTSEYSCTATCWCLTWNPASGD
jgi:hypothetical protein